MPSAGAFKIIDAFTDYERTSAEASAEAEEMPTNENTTAVIGDNNAFGNASRHHHEVCFMACEWISSKADVHCRSEMEEPTTPAIQRACQSSSK